MSLENKIYFAVELKLGGRKPSAGTLNPSTFIFRIAYVQCIVDGI